MIAAIDDDNNDNGNGNRECVFDVENRKLNLNRLKIKWIVF